MPRGWGGDTPMTVFMARDGRSIIGPDVKDYKSGVKVIARNGMCLPLRYSSFQAIPEQLWQGAWIEIRDNCGLPDSAEKVVMADLKDVWRHWKCIIKSTYFAPHQNDDETLKKVPTDRIVAEEWPLLVQYWKDEKVKDIARRNTNNSIKRKFPHRIGRKPFTALADEIKATGKEPDNLEIWMSSRMNGRGGDDEMTDDILNPGGS
ncbi:uncharacterized protein LOC127248463 isoform X2 [Andrographis paniculata]|uniref:uncharacterized protein LOC127248463 isoform X2 n=1 Tax=Andrographis paniculata TaxID=175694 RepID=UPI0021E800FF|nr:uncharacterized protein LOC127248463 isoform X2 [Andrographis paniculata]